MSKVYCQKCGYLQLLEGKGKINFWCKHPNHSKSYAPSDTPLKRVEGYTTDMLIEECNANNDCKYYERKKWWKMYYV